MSRAKRVNSISGTFYGIRIKCPGCGEHLLPTQETPASQGTLPRWQFNGDLERPTFSPSILSRWYETSDEGDRMIDAGEPLPPGMDRYPGRDMVCHSFVTDGRIQFLSDCTHALAGQSVDLPDVEGT